MEINPLKLLEDFNPSKGINYSSLSKKEIRKRERGYYKRVNDIINRNNLPLIKDYFSEELKATNFSEYNPNYNKNKKEKNCTTFSTNLPINPNPTNPSVTLCVTLNTTSGVTSGATSGATSGGASGASGATFGAASGASGATLGSTSGATYWATSDATSGVTSGGNINNKNEKNNDKNKKILPLQKQPFINDFFLHKEKEKEKENEKEMDLEMDTFNTTTEINLITSSPVTPFFIPDSPEIDNDMSGDFIPQ